MNVCHRHSLVFAVLLIAGCSEPKPTPAPRSTHATSSTDERTLDEIQSRIAPRGQAAVTLRSGPQVPVRLPPGFTLYPGADVISNTRVERKGTERTLLVFETPDRVAEVVTFYRRQAGQAGATPELDIASETSASFGARRPNGRALVIVVRREAGMTRAELSTE